MFEKSFDHFLFFIFLVTLATVPVSFSIYYHFLCKIFTNFSPRRHVNDFKGTYFVEKINIYQIKNSFVFTSKDPRIEEFISSAADFSLTFLTNLIFFFFFPASGSRANQAGLNCVRAPTSCVNKVFLTQSKVRQKLIF